jgi:hypothetical protein
MCGTENLPILLAKWLGFLMILVLEEDWLASSTGVWLASWLGVSLSIMPIILQYVNRCLHYFWYYLCGTDILPDSLAKWGYQ